MTRASRRSAGDRRIVRLLPVLDDADILERNLDWYAAEGIETVAVDNGSGDAARELCLRAARDGRIAALERFDDRVRTWSQIATRLLALASGREPDVVLLAAADEFMESPGDSPLRRTISEEAAAGRNLLRVSFIEFCMTVEDDPAEPDPLRRERRYSRRAASGSVRGALWSDGPDFEEPRRCTLRPGVDERLSDHVYLMRHYPFRSPEQAFARARADRLRPMLAGSFASPLRGLVDEPDDLVIHRPKRLPRYVDDRRWSEREAGGAAYLANAVRILRRSRRAHRALRREHADLKRRYGEALLERDRLRASTWGGQERDPIAATADWYDERYRLNLDKYDVDPTSSPYAAAWQEIVARLGTSDAVLEIGCGTGQLAQLLQEVGIEQYVGFDFSAFAVGLARRRVPGADLRVDDARTTSLIADGDFATVLCTEVLEHLDDDLALLARIPSGRRVLATVPSFDSTSHLRFFASATEARERYDAVLAGLSVELLPLSRQRALYLLDGRTR